MLSHSPACLSGQGCVESSNYVGRVAHFTCAGISGATGGDFNARSIDEPYRLRLHFGTKPGPAGDAPDDLKLITPALPAGTYRPADGHAAFVALVAAGVALLLLADLILTDPYGKDWAGPGGRLHVLYGACRESGDRK
ncbi:Protein of unknown function [Gryllus bimaculatus]|nr:Protein of unknown function [Gryllus bimaculatus]